MKREVEDLTRITYGNGITSQITIIQAKKEDEFLGCCSKLQGEDMTTYEIILKDTGNDFVNLGIRLHEFGHILFGHLEVYKDLEQKVEQTIKENKCIIAEKINKNCNINFGEELLDQVLTNISANHFVHNAAMDLEVNSKVIGEEDILRMGKIMNQSFIYPGVFNFPENLSYPEYLILVINNLDLFIKRLMNETGGSTMEEILKGMGEKSRELVKPRDEDGYGLGEFVGEDLTIFPDNQIDLGVDEILKKYKKKITKRSYKKDFLYLYNRGINRSVICPTYLRKQETIKVPGVVFLVDVSGSMNRNLVNRIITTIQEKIGKLRSDIKYSIVCWSTQLMSEFRDLGSKSKIPKISVGGGTRLAKGIEYIDHNYPSQDIMVIISDFCDNLGEWESITEKIKTRDMYGFCYGKFSVKRTIKNLIIKNEL